MEYSSSENRQKKKQLRQQLTAMRNNLLEVDSFSRLIWEKLFALPELSKARTVMTYLNFGNEVRTLEYVSELWKLGKQAVVPYCIAKELRLFRLERIEELSSGMWGILEPKPEWRERADRRVDATELDLIIVPGVAFDRRGGRLGFGKGYYDRFLQNVRADAVKIALAFQCQLVEEIPMTERDVRMDKVITEKAIYGSE
jgi:5-formyltetrahydrofolate cyclo-ligase